MSDLNLEQLLKGDAQSFERVLDVHFAQGKLQLLCAEKNNEDEAALEEQRQLANEWLFQQKFQLATWNKPAFQKLINGLNQHLHKCSTGLPDRLLAEIRFSFLLLDSLEKLSPLAPSVAQRLFALRPILLAYSVQSSRFWFSSNSMKKLFDQLYRSSLGLQSDLGRQADASISLLQQFIDKTMVHTLSSTQALFALMTSYKVEKEAANTRLKRLLDRLLETEKGSMKSVFANKHSALLLLDMGQGLDLPEYWQQFLLKDLRAELNVLIAEQGLKSKPVQKITKAVHDFLNLYKPGAETSFNMTTALELSVNVEKVLCQNAPHLKSTIESLFVTTANDLLQLESGQAVTCNNKKLQTLSKAGLEVATVKREVSQLLLNKVEHTRLGQWFLLSPSQGSNEAEQRVQLLLKLDDIQQYLFVNANGQKVLSCDIEQFSALLSSQSLKSLSEDSLLSQTLDIILTKLFSTFEIAEVALQDKQAAAQQVIKDQEKQLLRKQAAEKARLEAEVLEVQMKQAASVVDDTRSTTDTMSSNIPHDVVRKLRMAIDGLLIGSWIEVNDNGEARQLKLAVKFAATNRFVFVNPEGITDREMQRDELVEAVAKKDIIIMETDQFFADRLNALLAQIE